MINNNPDHDRKSQSIKSQNSEPTNISFGRLISTSIAVRFPVDIIDQIFNPFMAIIAPGLGLDVVTLGRLLSLRSFAGVLAPFIGSLADRTGYRTMIRLCLLITAIGSILIGVSTTIITAVAGLMLTGLATVGFIPILQAYSSVFLPYKKRARGMGFIENTWASAGIVGLPIMGFVINAYGWRAPFLLLGAGLLIAWALFGVMPEAPQKKTEQKSATLLQNLLGIFDLGHNSRSAYNTLVAYGLATFASVQLSINYSIWFIAKYQLNAVQLGNVALVFSIFDLIGAIAVTFFTDRIGKRRSFLISNIGMLIGLIVLPWFSAGVLLAIVGHSIIRSTSEFALISGIILLSEQVEDQPGKVLSLGLTILWIARAAASFIGPWLYINYGLASISLVSSIATCISILLIFLRVRDKAMTESYS